MDLFTLITYALIFAAGAFVGVLLGRRSKSANAYTDFLVAEAIELREKLAAANAKIKASK